jgi:deoxyribose-phosphate aldolase
MSWKTCLTQKNETMNAFELAQMIDHTLLKATATHEQVEKLCREALEYGFASVCVPPYYLSLTSKLLGKDPRVKNCTVIGFPLGYEETTTKLFALQQAIHAGADELDVVINLAAVKNGSWDYIENEVDLLVKLTKQSGKLLKIIFETCYLEDAEIVRLAEICAQKGVDFVKTSTGFGTDGATVEHVGLMNKTVGGKCRVKASGGIRNWEDARTMIEAGADRIGASAGVSIVEAFRNSNGMPAGSENLNEPEY